MIYLMAGHFLDAVNLSSTHVGYSSYSSFHPRSRSYSPALRGAAGEGDASSSHSGLHAVNWTWRVSTAGGAVVVEMLRRLLAHVSDDNTAGVDVGVGDNAGEVGHHCNDAHRLTATPGEDW